MLMPDPGARGLRLEVLMRRGGAEDLGGAEEGWWVMYASLPNLVYTCASAWGRHGLDVDSETQGACRGAEYLVNPSANQ